MNLQIKKVVMLVSFVVLLFFVGNGFITTLLLNDVVDSSSGPSEQPWNLQLVNSNTPISKPVEIDLVSLKTGETVDERILPNLQRMMDDARVEGIYPLVTSGYRTNKQQNKLMDEKIEVFRSQGFDYNQASEMAQEWVAIPGTSEHELGLAVDINADKLLSTNTEVYGWLAQNSYKYGFILRYTKNKESITGISYEPWHYRFVGIEEATTIYENDWTLEEYLISIIK